MLTQLSELTALAARAMARIRPKARIPVAEGRAPGPRFDWPSLVPGIEIEPGHFRVTVSCNVPGATPSNVLVRWDEEAHSLCIHVARAAPGGPSHDWYVELPLPVTVEGSKSKCTLEGDILRIRAPLHDTPAGTGLTLSACFERAVPCEPVAA